MCPGDPHLNKQAHGGWEKRVGIQRTVCPEWGLISRDIHVNCSFLISFHATKLKCLIWFMKIGNNLFCCNSIFCYTSKKMRFQ